MGGVRRGERIRAVLFVGAAGLLALTAVVAGRVSVSGEPPAAVGIPPGGVPFRPATVADPPTLVAVAPTLVPVPPKPVPPTTPSIVLVLMDDASIDLLQTMRTARAMQRRGATYRNAFVVDSMCCVSRTSLLTGQYPHQTGVRTNTANLPNDHGPLGGWQAFDAYGNGERSVNVRLQRNGWTTGFVGKFLNEYEWFSSTPPGWSEWRPVYLDAYDGWGFGMRNRDGSFGFVPVPDASLPEAERDRTYAGNVIADVAVDFVRRHRDDAAPYFLEVATYAPHVRTRGPVFAGDPLFPPAFADRPGPGRAGGNCGAVRCGALDLDDLPGFGDPRRDNRPRYGDGSLAPSWRTNEVGLTARDAVGSLRNRARMVQSVDRMLASLLREVGPDTYVILTSDNGFHLGQHGLERGKGTPYDSDVHVPLVVTGPGVPAGVRSAPVSNIDLAPTLEELAGLRSPAHRSGRSFVPSLRDPHLAGDRTIFFEHTHAPSLGGDDPDRWYAGGTHDLIPSYVAARDRDGLLVRVDLDHSWDGTRWGWEYYDYTDSAFEQVNTFHVARKQDRVRRLRRRLEAFLACRDTRYDDPVSARCRRAS